MSAYREDYTTPPVAPPPTGPVPVRVTLPARRPTVTYALIGLMVGIYLLQELSKLTLGGDLPAALGAKVNVAILAGQYWRLITPVLLHGSWIHLFFNVYGLVAFGRELELRMGHGRYLTLYLLGGFAGNVLSFLLTSAPSLGASTALFGLIAAEGVFLFQHRELFGERARSALVNVAMVAGVNLVLGLQPGIDNWGHVGGLLGGLLFTWLGGPKWEVQGIYPNLWLADRRGTRDAALGAALVLLIFGGLTAVGFFLK